MSEDTSTIAQLVTDAADGEEDAANRLMPLVYQQLHDLAQGMLRGESPGHTLQPTALVNEAYLRMLGQNRIDWQGKTHFYAIGAKMMRRILVDYARTRKRQKRGGDWHRMELNDEVCVSDRSDEDIITIEESLSKLEQLDPRQAKIVELRFFGGLTVEEVANHLGVSKRTVEGDWTMARAWLRRELSGESSS